MITRPNSDEYNSFYKSYIDSVAENDIMKMIESQTEDFIKLLERIPKEKHQFTYGVGKWTVTQVIRHVIDAERVFAYRAMCIARNDHADFPDFDQSIYMEFSDDSANDFEQLIIEFEGLRKANITMIQHFSKTAYAREGLVNGSKITVRALIYILCGHVEHHVNVLNDQYLTRIMH